MAQLQFKGKQFVQNYHFAVPHRVLKVVAGKSVPNQKGMPSADLDGNLIVHGDNLHALKALLPKYGGKVKCIYIDPPYNTGNEGWRYNDRVNSPMVREWLGKEVGRDDMTRHDKWLSMMMPRLKLLRELLRDDGVIFISIDDNEVHHLRMLMDDVFGEENFRNLIIVRRGAKSVQAQFETLDRLSLGAEYVLVYTKAQEYKFPIFNIELEETKDGSWNNHWRGTDRPTMRYEVFGIVPETGQWRWSKERSLIAVENYKHCIRDIGSTENDVTQENIDRWYFKQLENDNDPDLLRLSATGKPEHYVPPTSTKFASSLWADLKPNGSAQLKQFFGRRIFDNPKSIDLVRRIIKFAGCDKDSIILDSFAGSGTTAHAVLALNKEDGGNRKFILVECEDYADKITAERVRRVIGGVSGARDENLKKGLGGSFSFVELGEAIDTDGVLSGKRLPSFIDMARYIFYTATGKNIEEKKVKEKTGYIGETNEYGVYLFYKPDIEYLKNTALNLERAHALGKRGKKKRVVFAPAKYLDQEALDEFGIEFAQLPFGIYKR